MNKIELNVDKPQKLSDILYNYGLKPSQVNKLFKQKDVRVDNVRQSADCFVLSGQKITFFINEEVSKKFEIFYEDENIYIINKFEGIEVTGEQGIEGQLKNAIAVHRLDRNTKGLLIMAKNKESEEILLKAFKDRSITKKYICEVVGKTNFKNEVYSAYLFKDAEKSLAYVYKIQRPHSVEIKTIFNTLHNGSSTSIVECQLVTGKTHQIRAHLSFLGHAILGDGKYGKNEDYKKYNEKSQKLHCYYLKLNGLYGKLLYLNNKEFTLYPSWFNKEKILKSN